MPATPLRNNVLRLLDARQVSYRLIHIPTEEKIGATELAERAGLPPYQVYKTLVVLRAGKGRPVLAVIPGDCELDLKALRGAINEPGLRMATQVEAERTTNSKVGAISPLALLNRGYEIVIASQVDEQTEVYVSAGERGASVGLAPKDLLALTRAREAGITRTGEAG
jgi:Cys-tRNA(Pro)/Cys-tRNA(Cys) deacylase